MKQLLIIFFRAEGTKPWLVLACPPLASLSEAFGIGTLLPAANAVLGDSARETPGASQIVRTFIESLGISANLGNLLIISVALLTLKAVIAFIALAYAGILQLVAYAAVAVFVDWRIALLGAAAGAIITLTMSTRIRISNQAGYKQTDRISSLTIEMADMLNSIKALKSMDRCGLLVQGLSGLLRRIKRSLITIQLAKHGVTQGSDALVNIMTGAVAFGAYSLFGSTHPELLVTGIVFFQIVNNLTKLQKQLQTAVVVESSYVRTIELIKQAEGQKESHTGNVAPNPGAGCNFEGVTFAHGSTPVISNANFKVPANIITVLQGPSGSGKTTLIDLLIGLNTAQQGRVLIGGRPIETIDIKAWRQSIGYVPRELMLFHDTIHENIGLSNLDLSAEMIHAALNHAGASGFINALPQGIETNVGEMGSRLSGGQRQRISLAHALVTNPKILILVEVTSALDPETEAKIVSKIASLRGRYTIVVITHRPAWTRIADRLYSLSKGHVSSPKKREKPKGAKK